MEINILICTILSIGSIFIGDFKIFQLPLALIFIPMTILTNIFFKFHGTKQLLKNCSFVSILLFSLSTISFFINKLYLYDDKNDASFLISIFLISIAPILGWSLINLEKTIKVKNTLSTELSFIWAIFIAEIITYFFAGPNIFYRLANASLFFYLYSFFSTRESLLNFLTLQKLFFTIITFFLLIKTGARGALLLLLIFLTILIFKKILFPFIKKIIDLKFNLINFTFGIFIILISEKFFEIIFKISKRMATFFWIFKDKEAISALETYADGLGSIGARLKWYSYLFNPAKFLNNSELFGSLNPPWGYYPHNIFLDVMGNYGLPLFLITLTSAIYIFTNYLSLDEKNNSFFCTLLFSILLGSIISGASWDYYSIYISIPLILVTKRMNLFLNKINL